MKNLMFLFCFVIIQSCIDKNLIHISEDRVESKKQGVFIRNMKSLKPIITYDDCDTCKFYISDIWIENSWYCDNIINCSSIRNSYEKVIRIKVVNKIPDEWTFNYTIGTDFTKCIRTAGMHDLVADIDD